MVRTFFTGFICSQYHATLETLVMEIGHTDDNRVPKATIHLRMIDFKTSALAGLARNPGIIIVIRNISKYAYNCKQYLNHTKIIVYITYYG